MKIASKWTWIDAGLIALIILAVLLPTGLAAADERTFHVGGQGMSQKYSTKRSKRRRQGNRWIPVLLGLGGLALLAIAVLALRSSGSQAKAAIEVNGAPGLKVDKEQVDLGDVKLGRTVEVTFKVTNVGDQTLQLEEQPYIEVVEGC